MSSTLDDSIRSALAAIVAESPELGSIPADRYVPLRHGSQRTQRARRRSTLVAVTLFVIVGVGATALLLRRDPAAEPAPADTLAVATEPTEPATSTSVNTSSIGYLAVPTMDGGAFVLDGRELRMGFAVHDPSTALPQHTTNDVSVIHVGREQFGPLEDLATGAEIDWIPVGGPAALFFAVTDVRTYDVNVDPATTTTSGLVIVIDTASPNSGRQVVITAVESAGPPTTDVNGG